MWKVLLKRNNFLFSYSHFSYNNNMKENKIFDCFNTRSKYTLYLDLEEKAKNTKRIKRIFKMLLWYHWNEYSNPLTKSLILINIILLGIGAIVTSEYSCFVIIIVVFYFILLCDRGFGEPDCPYRKKK